MHASDRVAEGAIKWRRLLRKEPQAAHGSIENKPTCHLANMRRDSFKLVDSLLLSDDDNISPNEFALRKADLQGFATPTPWYAKRSRVEVLQLLQVVCSVTSRDAG